MKFSETVQNITHSKILPTIVDNVNNSNIFTARVTSNPKNWSGKCIEQTIQVANSTTGKSFSGLDTFDTSVTNNTRQLKWYVKAYAQTVVIPGIEKAANGVSESKVISLVASKMEEAQNSMIDSIGSQLYGTGIGGDLEGLGLIVDNGTATSSYGELSRAEYPSINGSVTAAASGNLSLDLVSSEFDNVSAAGDGKQAPTIALTTKSVWSLFEKLLQSTGSLKGSYVATSAQGYNRVSGGTPNGVSVPATALKGALGVDAISYRGKPVVADDKCPAGTFYWLNENYMEFRRLLSPDLKAVTSQNKVTEGTYESSKYSFLQLRDFMSPVNQFGEIGAFMVLGNLIHRQPRRNGKIVGITKLG